MAKISSVVITKDEESNIRECLESLRFTDEIIIIDAGSTDKTLEIAKEYTDKIYNNRFEGWVRQKNFGIEKAQHNWILSIDADERISLELKNEILRIKERLNDEIAGYEVPILPYYMGRWIRHSNWYPGYKVRLFNKKFCRWDGDFSHEFVKVNGMTARLKSNILHLAFIDFDKHLNKMGYYTTYSAIELSKKGIKFSVTQLICRTIYSFIKHYLIKRGFLDGIQGLVISYVSAFSVFAKYVKLYELNKYQAVSEENKDDKKDESINLSY
ncbi:MAG: glycosyltransferase family 2 protein [Candidatus Hydrogenedentota bacterium]